MKQYVITFVLATLEGYIFIVLYSLMVKFREELNELKLYFGEV